MSTPLTLDTARRNDGRLMLIAAGEIDLSNVDTFTRALSAAITDSDGTLTVDLSAVEYLDSAAINVLFMHAERIRLVAGPLLMSIFNISGLTQLTTIDPAPTADD